MSDLSYSTVMEVSTSWDKLKAMKNYRERAGQLFVSRIVDIEPAGARKVLRFTEDEDITKNPLFATHALSMVDMIDNAVSDLGPEFDFLQQDLSRLGERQITFGERATYLLPVVEKAVIDALEELLGDSFTQSDKAAWQIVFDFFMTQMTEEINVLKPERLRLALV